MIYLVINIVNNFKKKSGSRHVEAQLSERTSSKISKMFNFAQEPAKTEHIVERIHSCRSYCLWTQILSLADKNAFKDRLIRLKPIN